MMLQSMQEKWQQILAWWRRQESTARAWLSTTRESVRTTISRHLLPERGLRILTEYSWLYLYSLWLIAFLVAIIGFAKVGDYNLFGLIYKAAQALLLNANLGTMPANWYLAATSVLVPALTFVTVAAVLLAVFKEKAELFLIRHSYEDHVVICGLGKKGWLFVKDFRAHNQRVIVVEKDAVNPMLDEARKTLAMVIIGNAQEEDVLKRANIEHAAQLICVCGEDGVNAEIAALAQDLVRTRRKGALSCLAHIFSPRLGTLLRANIVTKGYELFRVDFFNVFRNAAREMLETSNPFGEKSSRQAPRPHILIVGLGWLGESLLIEAAKQWHSEHFEESKVQLVVTVIDKQAARLTGLLCARYPSLKTVCRLEPLDLDCESLEFHEAAFLAGDGIGVPVTRIYVCLAHPTLGLDAGLSLARTWEGGNRVPVMVRTDHEWGLPKLMPEGIRFFGILDQTCDVAALNEAAFEKLAQRIHERYVEEETKKNLTLKDNSNLVNWENLKENIKESNRFQAADICAKIHSVDCTIVPRVDWMADHFNFKANGIGVVDLAKQEHDRWLGEKRRLGYVWGPKKDAEAVPHTHPYILEWEDLLPCIRQKDITAIEHIPALLASVDLDIRRGRKIDEGGPTRNPDRKILEID
jgi:voltage-gated potassium channel Kch